MLIDADSLFSTAVGGHDGQSTSLKVAACVTAMDSKKSKNHQTEKQANNVVMGQNLVPVAQATPERPLKKTTVGWLSHPPKGA